MYARFRCEPDELVKTTIPLCLAFLSKSTRVHMEFFEEVLKSNESDLVKLSVAVSLAYIAGEHMSDEALEILVNKIKNPNLFSRLCEHYENPMLTAHYLLVIDFLTRLDERQMPRVIQALLEAWAVPDYLDLLIELAFQENKIPSGSTINDLTESQQLVLRAIADSTSTGLEMLYRNGTLDFMGIRAVSPAHGSSAREKLIEFLNGEKLRYDT